MKNKDLKLDIFVASSLKLNEQRNAVEEATKIFNKENNSISFECFLYERPRGIFQVLNEKTAQEDINKVLCHCPIFFLILEDKVKDMTRLEFEVALNRFRDNKMPRLIYIFRAEGVTENKTEGNALTYEEFIIKYNLITCKPDMFGDLVPHNTVYDIPFSDSEDLTNKILEQLKRLPGKMPPQGAKLGNQLTKEDFYSDELRREGFPIKNSSNLAGNEEYIYYHRNFDDRIREEIKTRKMILVTGQSLSGKTRSIMEALREISDGWVYTIGDRKENLMKELNMLKEYMLIQDHLKLYIEIDNIDQHVADKKVREALYNLINVVMNEGCNGMIVSTASNFAAINDHLPLTNYGHRFSQINIPQLSPIEFRNAIAWFRSCGVENIKNENIGYKQLGAVFVDLTKVKDLYDDFLKEEDNLERQSLLKAIKAQSIWRSDILGDIEMLFSMTKFFVNQDSNHNNKLFLKKCDNAVTKICDNGLMGVTMMGESRLNIEEYIYQYIIDYDGNIISKGKNYNSIKKEKELAEDILYFCNKDQQQNKDDANPSESLTRQVLRILRRCDHKEELTPWLYKLWSGVDGNQWNGTDEEELAAMLQNDRRECEKNPQDEAHYYSGIVRYYFLIKNKGKSESNIESNINAYNLVPYEMRTDELFGSLLISANDKARFEILRHPDYERFNKMSYTVLAELEWANTYEEGKKLFEKVDNPCVGYKNKDIAKKLLNTNEKPYELFLYGRLLRKLATLIHDSSEFEDLCDLLRDNIICLISDQDLLEKLKNKSVVIDKESLTLIDLMGALGWWTATQCVINAFGDNLQTSKMFEEKLIHSVDATLHQKLTNELQTRMIVSSICSRLINAIADKTEYEDVYENLFIPLVIPHPLHKGQKMILRNTYTYTAMMKCRGINVRTSMNLFTNDLIAHVNDKDNNPLLVTRYTINSMLDMCRGEKKLYLEQVDSLYDILKIERDNFAYNILIETAPNMNVVKAVLNKMTKKAIAPNLFTYLNIQRNSEIDFSTALTFINCSECEIVECEQSVEMPDIIPVKNMIKMKDEKQRQSFSICDLLHPMSLAWINLFEKHITNDDEKKTYNHCLKHLQVKHPQMLEDGKIYNVVLKNNTYIAEVADTIKYITEKLEPLGFKPDGYTADSLLNKILLLQGKDQRDASKLLNDFIINHPKCLNNAIISKRIKLFRKQEDSLEFVFFDKSGNAENRPYSPIGYLNRMVGLDIPLDSYAIYNFLKIRDGINPKIYRNVAELLKSQSYHPNSDDIRTVREMILPNCNDLPEIYTRMKPMSFNKDIAWRFKRGIDEMKRQIGERKLYLDEELIVKVSDEVKKTLEKINWEDANSALCSFNDVLDKYVSFMRDEMKGRIWPIIHDYYEKYVKNEKLCSGPTSFTINLLAKSLTNKNIEGRKFLISEVKKCSGKVAFQPHLLGELARTATTVKELIETTQAIKHLGCTPNSITADIYLFYLTHNLMNKDIENAKSILIDLINYVFDEECNKNQKLLEQYGRSDLLLDFYKDKHNISANMLHSLLYCNQKNKIFSNDTIIKWISTNCPDNVIAGLMDRMANDKNKTLAQYFIPELFNKRRNYSHQVLLFLSSKSQLPHQDFQKYCSLLQKFYEYHCEIPESVISNLLDCLFDYSGDDMGILGRIKRMYVKITLGWLRQGDMLIKTAPIEYANWCKRSLDCLPVRNKLQQHLYLTLIRLYILLENIDIPKNKEDFQALQRAERIFASRVSDGDVNIEDIVSLPNKWYFLKWRPSTELILAIVRFYAIKPHLAIRQIVDINQSINKAKKNKETWVRYNSIGDFPEDNGFYSEVPSDKLAEAMPHPFIVSLCRIIANNYNINNNKKKKQESDFFESIRNGGIDKSILDHLPSMLRMCRWRLAKENISVLEKWFSSKGYLSLINYICQESLDITRNYYLLSALKKTEEDYIISLKKVNFTYNYIIKELESLPELWSKAQYRPSKKLIYIIVSIYAQKPYRTYLQIAKLQENIYESGKEHLRHVQVKYQSMGYCPECTSPIEVSFQSLMKVMPAPYIVSLCSMCAKSLVIDTPNLRRKYEREYIEHIKKNGISIHEQNELVKLWKKSRWEPLPKLLELCNTNNLD